MRCTNDYCERHHCSRAKDCPSEKFWRCDQTQKICVRRIVAVCENNFFCAPGTGYCINTLCTRRPPILSCTSDSDCPKSLSVCSKMYGICTEEPRTFVTNKYRVCNFNNQCPENTICMNNWCREISLLGYPVCRDDTNCRYSEKCIRSVCVYKDGQGIECTRDKECGRQKFCFEGSCLMRIPIGCIKASDCPLDYPTCLDGVCRKRPVQECSKISDCGAHLGYMQCVNKRCHQVVPAIIQPPMTECDSNENCLVGRWCLNGICQQEQPFGACVKDEDCDGYGSSDILCWDMKCQSIVFPEIGCTVDADCPDNRVCYNHVCYKYKQRWCRINADCWSKEPICFQNLCESVIVPQCRTDDDCPNELRKCSRNRCVREAEYKQCSEHGDCPSHRPFCVKNTCVIDVFEMCFENRDCASKNYPNKVGRCLDNKWCQKKWFFSEEKLVIGPWMKTKCVNDDDCNDSVYNQCIRY